MEREFAGYPEIITLLSFVYIPFGDSGATDVAGPKQDLGKPKTLFEYIQCTCIRDVFAGSRRMIG